MILCEADLCTGCEACRNACPHDCIAMVPNAEGFLHPHVDTDRCTECGLCRRACPVLNERDYEHQPLPKAYACWHNDDSVRRASSSGGAFSALAETTFENGGLVFGAAYDDRLHVRHVRVDDPTRLDTLRRSKYVQSEIGLVFREIREALGSGTPVLFVGTPCQVAGLHGFLGTDCEGLTTCDLVCHGVPSPKVFARYIEWLDKTHAVRLTDLNFRDKRKGWEDYSSVACDSSGHDTALVGEENSYFNGYNMHMFLRESCYSCRFKGFPRPGDLTLGDYWGIGKQTPFPHDREKREGISLILVNSQKGEAFLLERCRQRCTFIERDLQEAIDGNAPLHASVPRHPRRDEFFRDLDSVEYGALAQRYFQPPLKSRIRIIARERLSARTLRFLRKVHGYVR